MRRRISILLTAIMLFWLLPYFGRAQSRSWAVSISGGAVHNFRTPLRIHQHDAGTTRLNARYRTEPFNPPVYYDISVSTWHEAKGWEFKFTHHKLILDNNPPAVQRFSITNGFNLLTLNRLWLTNGFILSAGGGIVITHPESTIRNMPYPENKGMLGKGYYISGPTLEIAIARRFYLTEKWFILGEGRATSSYVRIPVANGNANVTNVALHGLVGIGFQLNGNTGTTVRKLKPS